jgi:hypothetical protein
MPLMSMGKKNNGLFHWSMFEKEVQDELVWLKNEVK